MLCRSFRSVGDEIFIQSFEEAALPFEDWTHEAHLRMAWTYIKEHGREGAEPFIKYVTIIIEIRACMTSIYKHDIILFAELYFKLPIKAEFINF